MDIMMPKLFWVNGAYYRDDYENHVEDRADEDPDDFITGEDNDVESEEVMAHVHIEEQQGQFRAQLDIPKELHGFLIGKSGESVRMVKETTGCRINIPKASNKHENVEVVGDQRRAVVRASNMLLSSAERGRSRLRPSHFVAVRLATQHVQNRLETFKKWALAAGGGGARGVQPALFQEGCRIHLTICVLTLLSETERSAACRALTDRATQLRSLLPRSGLSLRVRELDIMNDDPSDVRVLYARVTESDGSGTMQQLADRCLEIMTDTGLVSGGERGRDSVKLHCTLMNSSFLVRNLDESDPSYRDLAKSTFDATHIMKELGSFDFGTVAVDKLEVVQRQAYEDSGFYLPIGSLSLKQ